MRYAKPTCPECGDVLDGECDLIPARAQVEEVSPDVFAYTGQTIEFWEGQVNEQHWKAARHGRKAKRLLVECRHGHQWLTTRTNEADDA